MGLVKKAEDERRSKVKDTLGALGGGFAALKGLQAAQLGQPISKFFVDKMDKMEREGKYTNNMTPEESKRLAEYLGISDIPVVKQKNPLHGHFCNTDIYVYDKDGEMKGVKDRFTGNMRTEYVPGMEQDYDRLTQLFNDKKITPDEYEKALEKAVNRHGKPVIATDPTSVVYAHEGGHASSITRMRPTDGPTARKLKSGFATAVKYGTPLSDAYIPGMAAVARQIYKERTGDDNVALQGADYAGRVASGAKLFEEIEASLKGAKGMAHVQGMGRGLRNSGLLAYPFMTYAAAPLVSHVAAPLAVKGFYAMKRRMDRDDEGE